MKRALSRAQETASRGEMPRRDDNFDTIRQRIGEYERTRDETIVALRRYLNLRHVDGEGAPESVARSIMNVLKQRNAPKQ